MRRIATIIVALFACVGTGYGVAVAATTGTNVSCATATASPPDHTVGVDGTDVNTISGSPTTATDCETQTYTVPTATETATTTQTATAQTQTLTQTVTQTVTTTTTTPPPPPPPGPNCAHYASPFGSDGNAGSSTAPYATVQKLENSLASGQTGCLTAGTYGSTTSASPIVLGTSGTSSGAITITSADPANPAQINGWVSIRGNYVTLQDVSINGTNPAHVGNPCTTGNLAEAMEVEGNNDIIQYVDYWQSPSATSQPGNAIGIGFPGAGHGDGTIIRYSAIHDVGFCKAFDHLIYLSHGVGVQIYDNWMWNDAHGWGVQIYPAPSGAHIYANVIDRAGSGFVFAGGSSVSGNIVEHNVVANSTGLVDAGLSQGVGFSTCCGLGTGNAFNTNDAFNNPGGVGTPTTGLTVSGNITSDPLFVGASTHNYALKAGSPATTYGLPAAVGPGAYRLSTTLSTALAP